jgi:hypothetical protein
MGSAMRSDSAGLEVQPTVHTLLLFRDIFKHRYLFTWVEFGDMRLEPVRLEVGLVAVRTVVLRGPLAIGGRGVRVRGEKRDWGRALERTDVNGGVVCLDASRSLEGLRRFRTVWMRTAETAALDGDGHHRCVEDGSCCG